MLKSAGAVQATSGGGNNSRPRRTCEVCAASAPNNRNKHNVSGEEQQLRQASAASGWQRLKQLRPARLTAAAAAVLSGQHRATVEPERWVWQLTLCAAAHSRAEP
eukprot:1853829-Alexandrium_andersonii.AAC.1